MTTAGAQAGLETFDGLNIDYEHNYLDNPLKVACVSKTISLLTAGSRVLDVGCGTGMPVSEMLSQAGLEVVGFDISPKMIALAQSRVKGDFSVSDMLAYQPQGKFSAVLIIFSHLQLSYADFYAATRKFAAVLEPGGLLVIGQTPMDTYVKGQTDYDESGTYVEDCPIPFMGGMIPTFALSEKGQVDFLQSMGLEIVSDEVGVFQPKNTTFVPEVQQYSIARRKDERPLAVPEPLPKSAAQ